MNQALRPFPVQAILQQALQAPRHHLVSLFKLGWPFVIFMLFYHSPKMQQMRAMQTPNQELGGWSASYPSLALIISIFLFLVISNFILCCYRKLILGESASWFKAFKIRRILLPFIAKSMQIALAAFALFIALLLFLSPMLKHLIERDMSLLGEVILLCPLYFFLSRWLLMLPANATGQHFGFSWSMQISKPYVWPIFLLNGLFPIIVQSLLHKIPTFDMWIMSIFVTILSVLIAVIQIALLALTYQFLTETSEKADSIENSEESQQEKVNHDDPANQSDDSQQ